MNNSTFADYLTEFYGPSSRWFSLAAGAMSIIAMLSDIFFLSLTLSSKSLRSIRANWFLFAFSCADLLHGSAILAASYAIWTGSVENRSPCARAGFLTVLTATCSFGFPPMIAAERFYKISNIAQVQTEFKIAAKIFSDHMILPLITFWFFVSATSVLPLLLMNHFGEDPAGFCGARKFFSIGWLILYESTSISVFFVGLLITSIYYYRLTKFLNQQSPNTGNQDSIKHTRQLMKMMKIFTLLPAVLGIPIVSMSGGQMLLPKLPMWLTRLLIVPYSFSYCINPWLTIALLRPFRQRFWSLMGKLTKYTMCRIDLRLPHSKARTIVRQL